MVFQLVLRFCVRKFSCFYKQSKPTLPEDLQFYSEVLQKYAEDPSV